MSQHFLLSAKARTLSLAKVMRLSDDEAFATFKAIRWAGNGGDPACPKCGCVAVYEYRARRIFKCKGCFSQFSLTSGTIFASRKLPLRDILAAIAIFVNGAKGHSALQLIQRALAKDDAFHKGLASVGTIKELHPSDYQRDVVWQRTRDEMREVQKSAERQSILFHLAHRSTLLYGKRSLTYVTDPDGNQRPVAMDLKSFETSFEVPRRQILDPVSLDYMLRIFRAEKFR